MKYPAKIIILLTLILLSFSLTAQVTDIDGNVYNTITIGTQVWMKENLKVTHYNNGDVIPNVTDDATWQALTTGAISWYNNDAATYKNTYGALYNWYTVSDSRQICPTGWHVPTADEWTALANFLGGTTVAGGKLKEAGLTHWSSPNTSATNESGFTALPGGARNYNGSYTANTLIGYWWSSTAVTGTSSVLVDLYYDSGSTTAGNFIGNMDGLSIRCIKNSFSYGLVGYYPFNGNAVDESGNGNNGIVNGATLTTDRFGDPYSAYSFGENTTISMGNVLSDVFAANSYSISLWYNRSVDNNKAFLQKWQNCCPNTGNNAFWATPAGFSSDTKNATYPAGSVNNWTHWVATMNSGTLKIYVNGVLKLTESGHTSLASTMDLIVSAASPYSFDGKIDDIRIYNRSLSTTEINSLYHENEYAQVTDNDGNIYNTVKIGNQEWMQENLKVTHYKTGEPIPNVIDNTEWLNLTSGAFSWYNNDYTTNGITYGGLYNWYAVTDQRGVCPDGWRVSTDYDWKQMEITLGMSFAEANAYNYRGTHNEGGKLKETGLTHWQDPNLGADNSSGFKALGGGYRYGLGGGTSYQLMHYGCFWSDNGTFRTLMSEINTVLRSDISDGSHKNYGFSVRCIKDDISSDVVAYYPFNGNANDESGNGHNAVAITATLATDRFGNLNSAYSFDGTGGTYIKIADDDDLDPLNDFTMAFWIKPSAYAGIGGQILNKYKAGINSEGAWAAQLNPDKIALSNSEGSFGSPTVIPLNHWIFGTIVFEKATNSWKIYLNGKPESSGTAPVSILNNIRDLYIGIHEGASYGSFAGLIDDIRIYNRVLQDTEINSLYHDGGWGYPPTITTFTPSSGPIGTSVTITGSNFDPTPSNNIVRFGAVKASVQSATSTELVVTVPSGASYQPISVTNTLKGLTAYSTKPFTVTFPSSRIIDAASFEPPVSFSAGSAPTYSAIADIDGDGKPDIIYSNAGSNTISIRRNIGSSGSITTGSFAANYDLSTGAGSNPIGVNIGDLDGDSKPDIVVTNYTPNTVSVFRNTSTPGSLSFDARVDFATAVTPHVGVIADFDNDGKPDIATECYNSHVVSVLRNISVPGSITSSSFAPKVDFAVGSNPRGITAGDFNNDGKTDLAIANHFGQSISVLINSATTGIIDATSFAAKIDFTAGTQPCGITCSDIDNDGNTDILVANYGSNTVSAFRNIFSTGSFSSASLEAKVDFNTGSYPMYVFPGDIDGDSKPEMIVNNAGSSSVSIFKNRTTTGSLTGTSFDSKTDISTIVQPTGMAVGDLDGDGKPDIVNSNNPSNTLTILRNIVTAPVPVITSFTPTSGPVGTTVTITGNNFDPTPSNNIVRFGAVKANITSANSTQLTVSVPAGTTYQPITVTVNGLTAFSFRQFNITFPSTQTIDASSLSPKVDLTGGGKPYHVAIGDIDGDGKPDMATVNLHSYNTVSIYRNIGNSGTLDAGSFATRVDLVTDTNPYGVLISDIDGDGKQDLAVSIGNSNTVSVFRNIGSPGSITSDSFAPKVSFQTGSNPFGIDIGDIDGDGRPDLVTANFAANTFSVLRNTSIPGSITVSSFAPKVDFIAGNLPYFITIDDFDKDGKPDVALTNYNDNNISVYRNTSSKGLINAGSFSDKVDFTTGNLPINIISGDIDGDEKPDIVVTNNQTNNISVFRNTSTSGIIDNGSFSSRLDLATEAGPTVTAFSDIDGDGKVDLAISNYGAGTVTILKNISSPGEITSGSFQSGISFASGSCFHIASGDLDCDGKPDLAGSNNNGNTIPVMRNIIVSLAPPSAPTAITPTGLSQTSFNANWNSSATATGYYLDVSTASDFSSFVTGFNSKDVSNVTTYSVTGLTANTTYYYRVRAYNGAGSSASSNQVTAVTLPNPPAAPVATSQSSLTQTAFSANWNASATATGYYLDVSTAGDFSSFVAGFSNKDVSNVTTYNVTGLLINTPYYYRVRAYNTGGTSTSSNTISLTTLPSPPDVPLANAASGNTLTGFTANWAATPTATGYYLDVSTDNAFSSFITGFNSKDVSNVLFYDVTGLTENTVYYYRIRAYNSGGASGNSNVSTTITMMSVPAAPVPLPASHQTLTSFNANWNYSATASGYYLDVATDNSFTNLLSAYTSRDIGNQTGFGVLGLTANTTYYYRVRAYNSGGSSNNSITVSTSTLPNPPPAPVANAATLYTQTSFTANWASSATATGYFIDVASDIAFSSILPGYSNVDAGNLTSINIIGLTANTPYYYRVRAYNTGGTSGSSNTITATTLINPPPAPVANAADQVTQTSIRANWSAAATATGYRIDVSSTDDFSSFVSGYNDLDVSNVTSFTINGLTQNNSYFYRVRAYNAGGNGPYSNTINQSTLPDPPGAVTPLPATAKTQTQFQANWQASPTATGYYLDVANDQSFTNFITGYNHKDVGAVTSFTVTGLTQNSTYYYRIIPYNTGGSGPGSTSVNVTTLPDPPAAPVALPATNSSQTAFKANWNHSATATGYLLDVATDNAFTTFVSGYKDLDVSWTTSYNVTGLSAKTNYYFRLKAYNSGGSSLSYSNTIPVTTLPNPPAAPAGLTAKSCNDIVTLSWTANAEGELLRYRIYGGQTPGTTTLLDSVAAGTNTKTFAGLQHGKVYYFRLKAVSAPNVSGNYSSELNIKVKVGHIPKLVLKWGEVLVCSNAADSIVKGKYQWYRDNVPLTTDFTANQFLDTKAFPANFRSGIYKVRITDKDGCVNFSNPITVTGAKSLSLYPNPAKSDVAVSLKDVPVGITEISIINNAGVTLREIKTFKDAEDFLEEMDVSDLDEGIYFVKVVVGDQYEYFSKIIVIK